MTIEVNSIQIPREFVEVSEPWYGGQNSMLYAVCSTGNLTVGPRSEWSTKTDAEIYLEIWQQLCRELSVVVAWCQENTPEDEDLGVLDRFHTFATATVEQLLADPAQS